MNNTCSFRPRLVHLSHYFTVYLNVSSTTALKITAIFFYSHDDEPLIRDDNIDLCASKTFTRRSSKNVSGWLGD